MRNCSPHLLYEGISDEGLPFRVYQDRMTGTRLIAFDFEALRKNEEALQRARVRTWREPRRKTAYHKSRDD